MYLINCRKTLSGNINVYTRFLECQVVIILVTFCRSSFIRNVKALLLPICGAIEKITNEVGLRFRVTDSPIIKKYNPCLVCRQI